MNILHIDCSARAHSHSRQLSAGILAHLLHLHPQARVVRRDLGHQPIAHAGDGYATALASPAAMTAAPHPDAVRLSDELIGELEAADLVVIGTPMHNFTVPSVLKAWIDQIVRIGRSFAATSEGKQGLLADRPVFVAVASGGVYSGERASQPDFLTPYLQAALGCVGVHDLRFLPLQVTAFLDADRLLQSRASLLAAL
ncbi:FMN-dependent NADH-azoreductase [Stenotrophomonas maltophilia]|jgi:FMN-dependent NADH-azoreductase|uniref:FMN-dependent NADH-azoreductase n=1 Tax=Stenotrophomonas chelatiphaga TaxID=517011 RepID=UPI000F4CDCD4|nr:NAD(P)H-dependent oxidoreductase [Stenotrophomonas chelatiphaga]MCS4231968.1 FMN-dependent NADH-azoreductase [Stenotrophomonas chelatiphaga]ROQ45925.1 FMN-dependent NADH-azoreductase [Stenotrophomonas maltophilia]